MELLTDVGQKILISLGGLCILMSIVLYARRTSDIGGSVMLFVKRIEMSVNEYKWYRIGISSFVLGVVVKVIHLTLWG